MSAGSCSQIILDNTDIKAAFMTFKFITLGKYYAYYRRTKICRGVVTTRIQWEHISSRDLSIPSLDDSVVITLSTENE